MRVTSDLEEIKGKYKSIPEEINLIETDSDVFITTGLNTNVTETMDPLELVAWARRSEVDTRDYDFTTILGSEVNELFQNRISDLKYFVPISILRQSRLGTVEIDGAILDIISERHLIMETLIGFRARGIMDVLLYIREKITGTFKENYSANALNVSYLLKKGYKINRVVREGEYNFGVDEKIEKFLLEEIDKRIKEFKIISEIYEKNKGFNPVKIRKQILDIVSLPDILMLKKE